MTHLSQLTIDKKTENFLSNLLHETFTNLKPKEVDFLEEIILSKTEIQMIKKRLGVLWLLEQGVDQSDISNILKLTRQTVYRIFLTWKSMPVEAKKSILKRLQEIKKNTTIKEFLKELSNIDISATAQMRALKRGL